MKPFKKLGREILPMLMLMCFMFSLSGCNAQKVESDDPIKTAESVMAKYTKSWEDKNPKDLMKLYTDDFVGYDALSPGWTYNYAYAEKMSNDSNYWSNIKIYKGTSFVSQDGMFAASVTRMDYMNEAPGGLPNLHIVALKDGKVAYAYDYYGMGMSETESLPVFESRTIEPGSDEAKNKIDQASKIIKQWQKAYNDKNSADFLACYADNLRYVDFTEPEWQVMTKDELGKVVLEKFSSAEFVSKLASPMKSPIPDGFFVSPDGHYVVAQGTYEEKGKITARPMAITLEIKEGKIVKQYTFMRQK